MVDTPLTVAILAAAGAVAGVWLSGIPEIARKVIPFSGLLLVTLSIVWILPELAARFGAGTGVLFLGAGAFAVFVVDRFVVPVCPACAHNHDHEACKTRLHGFENPLIIAALLHGIFDGWALAASSASEAARALLAGVLIHKAPEALAYGVMLNAAFASRKKAYIWAVLLQFSMLAGVWLYRGTNAGVDERVLGIMLATGGGMFLYLGSHAIHAEWKRRFSTQKHAI